MSSVDQYRACLGAYKRQGLLSRRIKENRLRPPSFNIFRALGHAYREVGTHSAMIAYLLNPTAGHEQGILFLRDFLLTLERAGRHQGIDCEFQRPEAASGWSCRKEFVLGELGRADIVLTGPDLLLIIENKVRAELGADQLERYWRHAKVHEGKHRRAVIAYLTPDGRAPTEPVPPGLEYRLILLSYHYDVYQFLQRTADSLEAVSVAEVVRQYAALVRDV